VACVQYFFLFSCLSPLWSTVREASFKWMVLWQLCLTPYLFWDGCHTQHHRSHFPPRVRPGRCPVFPVLDFLTPTFPESPTIGPFLPPQTYFNHLSGPFSLCLSPPYFHPPSLNPKLLPIFTPDLALVRPPLASFHQVHFRLSPPPFHWQIRKIVEKSFSPTHLIYLENYNHFLVSHHRILIEFLLSPIPR